MKLLNASDAELLEVLERSREVAFIHCVMYGHRWTPWGQCANCEIMKDEWDKKTAHAFDAPVIRKGGASE